ncbi:MAG TPA: polysaccharide deacetylase family protein [Pyrinomonadaceae bacterium]|jgi:peptidoglycan/xylan/chitin deacetylase (PgdA/CDA1 family)
MIGRNRFKRAIKRTAGRAAMLTKAFGAPQSAGAACIFYFHRVAEVGFIDSHVDDWNIPPAVFERQIAALADFAEIVPLQDLPRRLSLPRSGAMPQRPLVSLTFDDGYANFHTQALPVLKRYGAHATLFVVTGTIGSESPMPFDGWALKNRRRTEAEAWRALNWTELESCAASGLVSVGAHSHEHLRGSRIERARLVEEAERSREILRARLGEEHARAYAYPYGSSRLGDASEEYARAVREAGYALAVTTDLGLARAESDPYLLPRIEAHALDAAGVLEAKAVGSLVPYRFIDHLRVVNRAV